MRYLRRPTHAPIRTADDVAHDIMIFALFGLTGIIAAYAGTHINWHEYLHVVWANIRPLGEIHWHEGWYAIGNRNPLIDYTISQHSFIVGLFGHRLAFGHYGSLIPFMSPNAGSYIQIGTHSYGIEYWGHPGMFHGATG